VSISAFITFQIIFFFLNSFRFQFNLRTNERNTMKKRNKWISMIVILCLFAALMLPTTQAYSAPVSTVKVGLNYGSGTVESANLENVSGMGSGYEFGYYDSDRNFVSLGSTAETQITMLWDRNMVYSSSGNSYSAGSSGSVVVGCYHIQLNTAYSSYSAAKSAATRYSGAFVKYSYGQFYVCIGNYISDSAAKSAAAANGISNYVITSGSSYTVTVVKTGTNTILFEFEHGTVRYLGVRPLASNNAKCQTWFKGYKYYGGFQYARLSGGEITVVNFVDVEDYVKGVIPYEMSNSWPVEALKAQACCARTYVMSHLNGHSSSEFDVCNTTCCQVYRGNNQANSTTDTAVDETAGMYITYDGALCQTVYMALDGGATENSENVWAAPLDYLRGVQDPYEATIADSISDYYWTETYTSSELTEFLRNEGYSCSTIVDFKVSKFTDMGNVYSITLTDANGKTFTFAKEEARIVFGFNSQRYAVNGQQIPSIGTSINAYVNDSTSTISGNVSSFYAEGKDGVVQFSSDSSALFAITGSGQVEQVTTGNASSGNPSSSTAATGTFTVNGSGLGHNVGMSQWGAYSMAKYHGKTYSDIIKFYYTGVSIG
jgi:stage II sporulation protein D